MRREAALLAGRERFARAAPSLLWMAGLAVAGSYLYVSGSATSIRRYRLTDLKTKLGEAGSQVCA